MLNFYILPQDYLKFTGTERLDLINRLSTNQVNSLDKFHGIKTILTSDKGRFVDLLTIYNFGDFVFTTCSFNNSQNVIAYLDRYTIMDDFTSVNMSGTHETILFYGDNLTDFIKKVTGIDITGLTGNNFLVTADHDAIIAGNDDAIGGVHFIYSVNDKEYWNDMMFNNSMKDDFGINEITESAFDITRIENGIPKYGNEMSDLTNPLECDLNQYVSFTKGCYIGQEVIARLDAYDKISKHMVGIKFESDFKMDVKSNYRITTGGKECGFVTSAAKSEKYGVIGLGFIKTIFLDPKNIYKIKINDGELSCSINKLPFTA